MRKIKYFKFKIYKRFQSEIWGNIILKNKQNSAFRMVLRNFRYLKYLFAIKRKKSYASSFFYNMNKFRKQRYKQKKINFSNNIIVELHNFFWIKFTNFYKKIDLSTSLNLQSNELFIFDKKKNIENCFTILQSLNWRFHRFRSKFSHKFKLYRLNFKRKPRFKVNKNNIYSHILQAYIQPTKQHYVKRKIPFWIENKLEKERLSLFFGLINKRRLIKKHTGIFNNTYARLDAAFDLVGQLLFFLYSINVHMNMYFLRNIIRAGDICLNGKIKTNPYLITSLFDNISVIKEKIFTYHNLLKWRFKNKLIIHNTPSYIEFNSKIMCASIWQTPLLNSIVGPYDYPFRTLNFDWLRFTKSELLPRKKIYK